MLRSFYFLFFLLVVKSLVGGIKEEKEAANFVPVPIEPSLTCDSMNVAELRHFRKHVGDHS